jgi:hypothetical protein
MFFRLLVVAVASSVVKADGANSDGSIKEKSLQSQALQLADRLKKNCELTLPAARR